MRVSVDAPVPVRSLTEGMQRAHDRLEEALLSSLGVPLAGGLAAMAVIGLILGATWSPTTADEGTALSTAKAALGGGHEWIEMLAPPLQVAVYVPFFIFGHPEFATVVPALFGALLLVLVVAVAWRVTGTLWAGAMSGLLLLSSAEYWHRSFLLPAYQMFVFFGYLGLALIASACLGTRRSTSLAIGGGVALALSACSFNIGLMFLPAALLLAFAGKVPWRRALLGPAVAGALLVPFVVWHVVVAGVRNVWIYPHSFLVVNHSADLQSFRHLSDYGLLGYITQGLPVMLLGAAPMWVWLLAGVGLLVVGKTYGARVSAAIAAAMLAALVPFVAVEQLPNARYGYLLVPAVALVAGVGLALALQSLAQNGMGRRLLLVGASLLAVVGASAAVSIHLDQVRAEEGSLRNTELRDMASRIDDDRAVLGRASYLQVLLPDNQVYSPLFLSEGEYLGYILWQDEENARRLLDDRDIGWVMFQKPLWKWERTFNEWAFRETGQPPRYYVCLPQSAGFTRVYDGENFALYKVDEGWLESESVSGSCPVTLCELQSLPGDWRLEPGLDPGLEPGQVTDGNYYCE